MLVDGKAVPGAVFDFAVYFFHNAALLLKKGNGPYFYRERRAGLGHCGGLCSAEGRAL